jgi:hypothetical protein
LNRGSQAVAQPQVSIGSTFRVGQRISANYGEKEMAESDGKNGGDGGVPTTVLTASISNLGNLSDPVDVIIEKLIRYVVHVCWYEQYH